MARPRDGAPGGRHSRRLGSAVLRTARTNTESTGSDAAVGQHAPGAGAGIADPATRTHHDAAQHHNHNFRGGKRSCYWPALQRLVENRPRSQHWTDDHLRWSYWGWCAATMDPPIT
jgi:hypothetical protein